MPSIAIIGASAKRSKYGNKAVRAYQDAGWTVYPVNPHEEEIEGNQTFARVSAIPEVVDRVALYVPPVVGMRLIDEIARVRPREIFFNPGSESESLIARARELGLNPILACAIISIGKQPVDYT